MAKIRTPEEIIERVTQIRARNNGLWMKLLALAFKAAPSEARKITALISKNDKEVTKWFEKL